MKQVRILLEQTEDQTDVQFDYEVTHAIRGSMYHKALVDIYNTLKTHDTAADTGERKSLNALIRKLAPFFVNINVEGV